MATSRVERDGVVYHIESGFAFEEGSARVWKEKLDKKTGKAFYVNLSTNEKKWSLPKDKKKPSTGSTTKSGDGDGAGGGPLTVPGFGSLLAFQPADVESEIASPSAGPAATSKKKSVTTKKKKKDDDTDAPARAASTLLTSSTLGSPQDAVSDLGSGVEPSRHGHRGQEQMFRTASENDMDGEDGSSIIIPDISGSPAKKSKAVKTKKSKKEGGGEEKGESTQEQHSTSPAVATETPSSDKKKKSKTTKLSGTKKKSSKKNLATSADGSDPLISPVHHVESLDVEDGSDDDDDGDGDHDHDDATSRQQSLLTNEAPSSSALSAPAVDLPSPPAVIALGGSINGGGERTPRQVSFVGLEDEPKDLPAQSSRLESLWGNVPEVENVEPAQRSRIDLLEQEPATFPPEPPNASGTTDAYPSANRSDVTAGALPEGDELPSWRALQDSFLSMVGSSNSDAQEGTEEHPAHHHTLHAHEATPPLGKATPPPLGSDERRGTRQLRDDWMSIMEPLEQPTRRLQQPEEERFRSVPPLLGQDRVPVYDVPPARLEEYNAEVLHEDEELSPARVVRVTADKSSDPSKTPRASSPPAAMSSARLAIGQAVSPSHPVSAPLDAKGPPARHDQSQPPPTHHAEKPPSSDASTEYHPNAEQLLSSLVDEVDFFCGNTEDAVSASKTPAVAAPPQQRLHGVSKGVVLPRDTARGPGPSRSGSSLSTKKAIPPIWTAGGSSSRGGGAPQAASQKPRSVTTPIRQIAKGPRYIQTTPRYPSSFADHRTRSPEATSSSRTPTPSMAIPRHSNSRSPNKFVSPQTSRSPSIPLHHYAVNYHDNVPAVASNYGASHHADGSLAVIDAQFVKLQSKNGGKATPPIMESKQEVFDRLAEAATPGDAMSRKHDPLGTPHTGGGQPPIVIYASPPPPPAGPLGWWGVPHPGGGYIFPPHVASSDVGSTSCNDHNASPPPAHGVPSRPGRTTNAAAHLDHHKTPFPSAGHPTPSAFLSTAGQPSKAGHRQGSSPLSVSRLSDQAALRVAERYRDECPTRGSSSTMERRPPHLPSSLISYLSQTERKELEELQQRWHAARDRAARLRRSVENAHGSDGPSSAAATESMRMRQEALDQSQARTHEICWQYHLTTIAKDRVGDRLGCLPSFHS